MSGGTTTVLGTLPGGTVSIAWGINDAGQIVGAATVDADNRVWHAVTWVNGTITDLGPRWGVSSWAKGINEAGQIFGVFYPTSSWEEKAFLYTNGSAVDLGTLGGTRLHPRTEPVAINAAGDVVGLSWVTEALHYAFVYRDGKMIDLTSSGFCGEERHSAAYAINSAGQVVGYCNFNSHHRAFLHSNGTLFDLNSLIPSTSGWILEGAGHINDAGQIVGWGVNRGQGHAFRLDPLPWGASDSR